MANEVEIVIRARDQSAVGVDAAIRRIHRLKEEAESVRDVHVKVDVDRSAEDRVTGLEKKLSELPQLSAGLTASLALGPALIPILGQAVTIAGSLASSFAGAAAAAGVFGAVLKSSFGDVQQASQKLDGIREKIRLLNEQAKLAPAGSKAQAQAMKEQAKATADLNAQMALLPPSTRSVVSSFGSMKSAWEGFKDANKGVTFGFLTRAFDLAKSVIPKLQPLFDAGAKAASNLLGIFERKVKDGGVQKLIDYLAAHAGAALSNVITILTNLGTAVGNFVKATDDKGGALKWITGISDKIKTFTAGNGLQKFLDWIRGNGPSVGSTLANAAVALEKIAKAVTPLAPISLALAKGLTGVVSALPTPVLSVIVGLLVGYSVAVKAIGLGVKIWQAATMIAAAAQWVLNAALDANPIGLVVLAIAALVAGFILAYKNSETFRTAVKLLWAGFKGFLSWLIMAIGTAVAFVIDQFGNMADFVGNVLSHIPGMGAAADALKGLGGKAHTAAQKVRDVATALSGVNSKTVDLTVHYKQLGSPPVGINSVFPWAKATGGIIGAAAGGGPRGSRTLVGEHGPEIVDLAPGSQVHSNPDSQSMLGRGAATTVVLEINSGGSAMDDLLLLMLRKAIRVQGGNVQTVLGT